jgi:DNA-binding CsgD family transcriptional regulator
MAQYVNLLSRSQSESSKTPLTQNEKDYAQLIGEGLEPDEIALRNSLPEGTLAEIEMAVITKLGLVSREEFIEYVAAQKWFSGNEAIETRLQKNLGNHAHGSEENSQQGIIESLTNREIDTLELLARRLYNQEIADELCISLETVKTHVKGIFQKLDVSNRREAASKAKTLNLIQK